MAHFGFGSEGISFWRVRWLLGCVAPGGVDPGIEVYDRRIGDGYAFGCLGRWVRILFGRCLASCK